MRDRLNTPVVFLIFNRPDLTQQVFNSIRDAQPQTLFVIADGPRHDQDAPLCIQAREILKQIDWDCNLIVNFAETNLGCRDRVSSGLNWVFSQVEAAIILEDDCLPDSSFFDFCQVMLDTYRDDTRVMHISGAHFGDPSLKIPDSYYFSKYPYCWGWATWRRAWQYYDVDMQSWATFRDRDLISAIALDDVEAELWTDTFDVMADPQQRQKVGTATDTWDYQWMFACFSQSGLSVVPMVNLVTNLGYRSDATHTVNVDTALANCPTGELTSISHPPFVVRNSCMDAYSFDFRFGGKVIREMLGEWGE
jgi:hypothetical protein